MIAPVRKKILFIGAGEPNASSRYRAEQFVNFNKSEKLSELQYEFFSIQPSLRIKKLNNLFYLFLMIFRKIYSIFLSSKYDLVYLQRNPVKFFSPYYEWIIKNILHKKVIFDFDDDLWIITGGYDNRIDKILNIADLVIVGNDHLKNKALKFNANTIVIPTVVDTSSIPKFDKDMSSRITVCWSGSRPGNIYLESIEDALIEVKREIGEKVHFVFSSDAPLSFKDFKDYEFVYWTKESESKMLSTSHIGLMPLPQEDEFARGKCGFKLILYGAYQMALIASPVGVNNEIVLPDINGFLVTNDSDWTNAILSLVNNPSQLQEYMLNSKTYIEKRYSLRSYESFLKSIFLRRLNIHT